MNKNTTSVMMLDDQLVAAFGDARLVRRDGEIYLVGGSMADRTEALEWMVMFLPEEKVRIGRESGG